MSLIKANSIAIPLADESVDLVVTSPPYFALRSYTDGGEHYDGQIGSEATPQDFLEALWTVTAECRRVLKPSGSMWVNLGDKYAGSGGHNNLNIGAPSERAPRSYNKAACAPPKSLMGLPWRYAIGCIDRLDLILRAEVVWSKPNGLPESVTDRVRRSHEQWFMFTKEPRYFAAVDEVREQHAASRPPSTPRVSPKRKGEGLGFGDAGAHGKDGGFNSYRDQNGEYQNPLGKLPGSVWTIPSEPLKVPAHLGVDHFAAFPQEWPRRIILGWSPSDGVVLDPFGGTGTVAMVANGLGRYGISIDLSTDYLRLADWRINESDHFTKKEEKRVKAWEKEKRVTYLRREIEKRDRIIDALTRSRGKGKPKKR